MSSNEKFEREFADFLAEEDSRLAAAYRKLPQMEPDPRLDGAVRAMAHRALNPQLAATAQADSQKRRRGRWLPALGAAAGVVFAAGIAFRLGPSWHGERTETGAPASDAISVRSVDAPLPAAAPLSPAPPPAETAAAPAGAASLSTTAKLKAQSETEAAKPSSEAQALEKAGRLDESTENRPAAAGGLGKSEEPAATAQPQAFPAPAPAPAPARKRAPELDAVERKQIMATGTGQNLHDRDTSKARSNAAQPVPPVSDKAAAAAAPADPRRQEELRAAPAAVQGSAKAPSKPEQAAPPPASPAPQAFAPIPSRAPASAVAAPQAKTDTPADAGTAREQPVVPAISGQAAQQKENEKIRSKDSNASLYPEHWLENIRAMLRDNHRDDAVRSLGEFRKIYPDYKLPDDLRDLE
ncbi:MAG TPA: hypothetical protein VLC97_07295 [Rhodanobacteraceae bacterium]|nr:hypothetical protein [Rhodanobacteraceae bacterium]